MNIYVRTPEAGGWTDAERSTMERMWGEGYSASEIAKAIPGRSRSSVLGLRQRLGLPGRKTTHRSNNAKPRAPRPKQPRQPRPPKFYQKIERAPSIAKANLWKPLPDTQPISILDRKHDQCAFPLDGKVEPGVSLYCGQPIVEGCSYCAAHARVVFRPRIAA